MDPLAQKLKPAQAIPDLKSYLMQPNIMTFQNMKETCYPD